MMMTIIDAIFEENNPAGVKTVLKELGICGKMKFVCRW